MVASWAAAPRNLCLHTNISFEAGATLAILLRGNRDESAFWPGKTPLVFA